MIEGLPTRLPSAIELSETMDVLRKQVAIAVLTMAQERVRLYGGGPGGLTLTDWSHLRVAVASLRALNAGKHCSGGDGSANPFRGGGITSLF
jgi:hypothetical protein